MRARAAEEWAILLLAVQFLTRLPVPVGNRFSPCRLAATPRWYPAVGALIGAVTAAIYWLAVAEVPPTLAALLSTAAGLALTGCLHEDGLADACDGLGGGATRAVALEIMRDSRIGTYGAAALGLGLATKVLALAALPAALVPAALIAGHAASRASSVLVIATAEYVRDHGTGKPVADGLGPRGLGFALLTGAAALLPLAALAPPVALAGGLLGLGSGHVLMRRAFERKLGGYTGDCLGAVQQTSEIGFYLGVLACL
jgi:adenosylcobinamide-GDP ribazoletransferase